MKLATLLRQIRTRINAEIMTQDQRDELGRVFLEKMAEKASKEKADAKKQAEAKQAEEAKEALKKQAEEAKSTEKELTPKGHDPKR
jgi:hypothetical protein